MTFKPGHATSLFHKKAPRQPKGLGCIRANMKITPAVAQKAWDLFPEAPTVQKAVEMWLASLAKEG